MKVKSESKVAQPCPTLSDAMDCSLPGSSAHGIFQARYWSSIQEDDFYTLFLHSVTLLDLLMLTVYLEIILDFLHTQFCHL